MSVSPHVPPDYPAEIIGYAEPWIVDPGSTVKIKISSTEPEYTYRLVRLVQGHEGEKYPPKREEEIKAIQPGLGKGRFQVAHPGSYAIVDGLILEEESKRNAKGIEVSFYFQPHLPLAGHPQNLVSTIDDATKTGFSVRLNDEGKVDICIGTGSEIQVVSTDFLAVRKRWVAFHMSIDQDNQTIDVDIVPVVYLAEKPAQASFFLKNHRVSGPANPFKLDRLLFGAGISGTGATDFFNGRIDSPTFTLEMKDGTRRIIAKYNFSKAMDSNIIIDDSDCGAHGRLINAPTRAVTGHDWDGTEADWTKAAYGYGAIHFHEDDLDDACWKTDFSFEVPVASRSGAYAVKVEACNGLARDDIVFFVRPSATTTAALAPRVAFVLSTFTYLAYGNERMYDQSKPSRMEAPNSDFTPWKDWQFHRMERRTDLGLSTYDVHRDESGVVYSSPRRPLLAVRPDHINWAMSRPREFGADLMMIGFLEHLGIPYDVITDHDLHFSKDKQMAIDITGYDVLITGCHPEYPSLESLNAYRDHAARGGSIMYLGGNGFYWVSALASTADSRDSRSFQGRLEVRRGDQGVRSYTLPGSEGHLSVNGQRGSLWRSRGRSPNTLFGVGCCGEGTGPGVPYVRTEASKSSRYAWMFENISSDVIGITGFGGGASGDEIDKYDIANGSPFNAVVLATTMGHSDEFGIFPEEVGFPLKNTLGSQTREIRSDVVYYETAAGGHVFSVGSINWYCSLAWEAYENDVARLTANVLRGFLDRN